MRFYFWEQWGIGARVRLVTLISMITIGTVISLSYFARIQEITTDLQQSGLQTTNLLADSVEYGVVSGNRLVLEYKLDAALKHDHSIYSIQVLDKDGNTLAKRESKQVETEGLLHFEAPISIASIPVNEFDFDGGPEASALESLAPIVTEKDIKVIGKVRLVMSTATLLAEKRVHLVLATSLGALLLLLSVAMGYAITKSITEPIISTIGAIRHLNKGEYHLSTQKRGGGEIGELQDTLNDMLESLFEFQQELEFRVAERTVDVDAARNIALKLSAERQQLIQQVTAAVEAERRSLAVDIHDHMNAALVVAKLEARRIIDLTNEFDEGDEKHELRRQDVIGRAEKILEIAAGLYKMARDIVKQLRPEVIDALGLSHAIEELVQYYTGACSTATFTYEPPENLGKVSSELSISVFRLVQEALSNILKYAEATQVTVTLKKLEGTHRLQVRVVDNGIGFDTNNVKQGLGLVGMRERVDTLGGLLTIQSRTGKGTVIFAELSLDT